MTKIVGIIGGMGPLATTDLMRKIIQRTPAVRDQDHLHLIVDNYPQIPDRTAAIKGDGADPSPYMVQSALRLRQAGAELLVVACNTAHFFIDRVEAAVDIPLLHMPRETALALRKSEVKRVGLLATDGTIATQLYQTECDAAGISVAVPPGDLQRRIMEGIYLVKSGELLAAERIFQEASLTLMQLGAEAIIAGCTEIPLALPSGITAVTMIDPTDTLAMAIVKSAIGPRRLVRFN